MTAFDERQRYVELFGSGFITDYQFVHDGYKQLIEEGKCVVTVWGRPVYDIELGDERNRYHWRCFGDKEPTKEWVLKGLVWPLMVRWIGNPEATTGNGDAGSA